MKAIRTKYAGATNTRGSRIIATAEGVKSLSLPYPHELSGMDAHAAAAVALAQRQKWKGVLSGGGLPDGSFAFTFTEWKSENGAAHKTERYKVNPARRSKGGKRVIHRAGLKLSAYIRRPSQITRKAPGKRLLKRRTKRVAKPVRGFFPNPSVLRWPSKTPRGYYGVFPARGGDAVYTTRDELIASRQAHLYADTHKTRYIVARKK